MATPTYHGAPGRRPPSGQRPERTRSLVERFGSWFDGRTPPYIGPGQPAPGGSPVLGCGTPAYQPAPSPPIVFANATTTAADGPACDRGAALATRAPRERVKNRRETAAVTAQKAQTK